ncbi:tRNA-dihydrouridine(20a/20b) synthase [NAD(P)+]-like [Penaeus monodon]|uniref:tRNA-dihydrouridine(20a/20b) synthase [NAD(P)+]-like n=1 Tax=Penaeus monodon TaxID=6687 RepID=UPI0018A79355|nr:tRNA-dihydrouridine(20a/20b) synthase [NAD(P)+]-like [Penaeus monodon]
MAEGYGACLIHKPELVADMIRQTRSTVIDADFTFLLRFEYIKIINDNSSRVRLYHRRIPLAISFGVMAETCDQTTVDFARQNGADVKLYHRTWTYQDQRSDQYARVYSRYKECCSVMLQRVYLRILHVCRVYESTPLECVQDFGNHGCFQLGPLSGGFTIT